MEAQRHKDVSVRVEAGPAGQPGHQLLRKELSAVDARRRWRSRRTSWPAACRGHGRSPRESRRRATGQSTLDDGLHPGEVQSTRRPPEYTGERRAPGLLRELKIGLSERALRRQDLRGTRGRIGRRTAQMPPIGVQWSARSSRIRSRIPIPGRGAAQSRHQPAVRQRV